MKSKTPQRLTTIQRVVIAMSVLVVSVGMLLVGYHRFQSNTARGQAAREVVIVPFRRYESTFTEQRYSGSVRLVISGTGQASGEEYSDAFYLYQRADGLPYDPPLLEHFDLELDGQRAIHTLDLLTNPPLYNLDHVYEVVYDVGDDPRRIALRISDEIVDDNTGLFRIEIYPQE